MAEHSNIEWTDATWNPIVGCSIVSPGCTNCYAMRMAARLERMMPTERRGEYVLPSHYSALTKPSKSGSVWTGRINIAPDHIMAKPLHWRKPRRIFVNSMSDLFHESVPDEWIDRVFAMMALAPQHTFQILTKRPDRMRQYIDSPFAHCSDAAERIGYRIMEMMPDEETPYPGHWAVTASALIHGPTPNIPQVAYPRPDMWPLPNVWLGISAENQKCADERVPALIDTPAAIRFISAEPLLGPLDLRRWLEMGGLDTDRGLSNPGIDQVIVGGESGPDARPMHMAWARSLRDQCASAGTSFLFKQWGEWLPWPQFTGACIQDDAEHTRFRTMEWIGKRWVDVGYPAWWHSDEGSIDDTQCVGRVGKKRAGRLLDGVEHSDFPQVRHA